jgi:hypothetical protein
MSDLTRLSDEDLRAALFDALVERLDSKAQEDPSISVVNRMPTVFALSRRGNLFTLSQGIGLSLLRGDLKWKDRLEKPRTFTVGRATIQSRLAIMPDRVEGTPDEIIDRIVVMFLDSTAKGEGRRPAVAEPVPERRPSSLVVPEQGAPTARAPQPSETMRERPATSTGSTEEPRSAAPRRESQPAPVKGTRPTATAVTEEGQPAPIRETTPPPLRTYQLLLETARREFDYAKAVPASGRHFLISAGVFVAFTAEAFFNDLGSRLIPSWSQLQRLDPREKAEVLSIELFNEKVNWSIPPFQSVAEALGFRRALAHAHAETLPFDKERSGDSTKSEVPRTRRTAWQEHCDVATIQRWITDVHLMIEHFSGDS